MNLRICCEVDNLLVDENGHPAPGGLCLTVEPAPFSSLPDYQEFVRSIPKEKFLEMFFLNGLAEPKDMRFITPEEFDLKYEDEEDRIS